MTDNIFFEINGVKFEGFLKASLTQTLENFVDIFSFTLSVKDEIKNNRRNPTNLIRAQDKIRIFIDNNLKLTGFVDKITPSFNDDSHEMIVDGRSVTRDLVDSDIIGKGYEKIFNFETLVRTVLDQNGYTDIKIINNLGALPINLKNDNSGWGTEDNGEEKKATSEKIFSFLDKYAAKAKVLLRTNENGNIVLTREETEKTIGSLISTKNNPNNNIKGGRIIVDTSKLFRFNEIYAEEDNSFFTNSAINQRGFFEDKLVRSPRRLREAKKFTSNTSDLDEIVKFETNLRRAQSKNYSCIAQGYYTDKKSTDLWQINKLVQVLDDKNQMNCQALIKGVNYTKDLDNGTLTKIDVVPRGRFNLDPDKVTKDSEGGNDFGNGLINVDV